MPAGRLMERAGSASPPDGGRRHERREVRHAGRTHFGAEVFALLHGPLLTPAVTPADRKPDYTQSHVAAWEGDPFPDTSSRSARRARTGRGAPVRSGGGDRRAESLRERGDPGTAPVAPCPLGPPVQCRRPGRGGHPRPGERGRAEPAPPHAHRPRAARSLTDPYATSATTASSARSATASAAGSRVLALSRAVWYVSNGTGRPTR